MLVILFVIVQEIIVYDFEDGFMLDGFILINWDMFVFNQLEDGGFVDIVWMVIESGLLESFVVLSIFWYVDDVGLVDDWMILLKIMVMENFMLSWIVILIIFFGNFLDSYQVLINGEELIFESFEVNGVIFVIYDFEEWEILQMCEVSLVDYVGQSVYIVFCNIIFSGDVLLIDDIIIIEGEISSVVEVDNVVFEFNFVFNLAGDVGVVLQYILEQVGDVVVSIQDMSGCQVQELCQGCFGVGCYNV